MSSRKKIEYYGEKSGVESRVPIRVKRMLAKEDEECKVSVEFTRKLDPSISRSLPYRRRKFEWKPPLHYGQMKLFISEVEFLTAYGDRAQIVVYAGAADGRHIPYLARMFPNHQFILYDPARMHPRAEPRDNIVFYQQLFTDETAFKHARSRLLFISDIRSMPDGYDLANVTPEMDQEIEEDVRRDMALQRHWCEIMRPEAAMLKFRLPYTSGETTYLAGDIYFQAFAPETSSESRLIIDKQVHKYETRVYNHEEYENYMYRFNRCTRIQPYVSAITDTGNEMPVSYDVWALERVIEAYCAKINTQNSAQYVIEDFLAYMSASFDKLYIAKKKVHEKHLAENSKLVNPM